MSEALTATVPPTVGAEAEAYLRAIEGDAA